MSKVVNKIIGFLLSLKLTKLYLGVTDYALELFIVATNWVDQFVENTFTLSAEKRFDKMISEYEKVFIDSRKDKVLNVKDKFKSLKFDYVIGEANLSMCTNLSKDIVEKLNYLLLKLFNMVLTSRQINILSVMLLTFFVCLSLLTFGFILSKIANLLCYVIMFIITNVNTLDILNVFFKSYHFFKCRKAIISLIVSIVLFAFPVVVIIFISYNNYNNNKGGVIKGNKDK